MDVDDGPSEEDLNEALRARYQRMSLVKDPKITIKENMGVLVLSCIMVCLLLFIAIVSLVAHYTASKYVIPQNQTELQMSFYNKTYNSVEHTPDTVLDTTNKDAKEEPNVSDRINVNTSDAQYKTTDSETNVNQTSAFESTTNSNVFKLLTTSTPSNDLLSEIGDEFYVDFYKLYRDTDILWAKPRLPHTVSPVHYKLHLNITVQSTSGRCHNFGSYTGNVTITINVRNDTDFIVIHAGDFRLQSDKIVIKRISKKVPEVIKSVRYNYVFENYVIKMVDILESGFYDISIINFTGCITKYTGLFLSSYTTKEGETR